MRQKELWPGWETVRVIGSGSFGKVYEIHKSDDRGEYSSALRVIAIPQSPEEYNAYLDDGYDEKSIETIFKRQLHDVVAEIQTMAQFKGAKNIVNCEDYMVMPQKDRRGWDILIRMELLTSLPDYYNKHGMSEVETIRLGIDICRALEMCERYNIAHHDIKPQNIFADAYGDFKLGDIVTARNENNMLATGKYFRFDYMAPELYQGKQYDAKSDIYVLGLVLYWLLNDRRLPFLPLPPTVPTAVQTDEAYSKRLCGEPIPMPQNCGEDLGRIVLKACAFNREERYKNATEMRMALAEVVPGKSKRHLPFREVEDDTQYELFVKVKDKVEKEATEKYLKDAGLDHIVLGSCHWIWQIQKDILKSEYGIDWHTPSEMHPDICFD